jgi:hypothetical protein
MNLSTVSTVITATPCVILSKKFSRSTVDFIKFDAWPRHGALYLFFPHFILIPIRSLSNNLNVAGRHQLFCRICGKKSSFYCAFCSDIVIEKHFMFGVRKLGQKDVFEYWFDGIRAVVISSIFHFTHLFFKKLEKHLNFLRNSLFLSILD